MSNLFGPAQFVGGIAIGTGVGTGVAAAVESAAQEIANRAWSARPNKPPDAIILSQAVVQGQVSETTARAWARQQGFGDSQFDAMLAAADAGPGIGVALELWRRKLIDAGAFQTALRREALEPQWINALEGLHDELLSSAELAMAQQQGFVSADRANSEGGLQGVTPERQQLRFEMSGLPPGVETALMMLRRGIIDQATFTQMVREGHTKTKYTDEFLALQTVPLSVAQAVQGVLRERIPESQGIAAAAKWGIDAATFRLLVNFAGRPPGIVQATTLVNRGVFNDADFREVVARSNVRTEYADALLNLRFHYPSLFQLQRMVSAGFVTPTTALDWLHKQGYLQPEWAQVVVKWAEGTTQNEKDLTKAELVTLYEGRFLSPSDLQSALSKMGYSDTEITQIKELADARRTIRFLNAALTKVHNQFVAFRIDEGQAMGELDAIGVASGARDDAIELWKIERQANVQPLTRAEILRAIKSGAVGGQTAHDMLTAIGTPDRTARILISTITKHFGGAGELTAPV